MNRYWALALIAAIVVAFLVVRRAWKQLQSDDAKTVDIPLWDEEPQQPPQELRLDEPEDDTAPAVLSPPELKPPRQAGSGKG
ncbi:MAG TPA: hypothetical protein VIP05_11910 [Burkholderiaceae bacterium]